MKQKLLICITILFFGMAISYSQRPPNRQNDERLKSLKVGYITNILNLSAKEAQQFWPIYNKHQDRIHHLKSVSVQNIGDELQKKGDIDAISEKEAEKILKQFLSVDDEIKSEESKMFQNLKPILSSKQLLKLHRAERQFGRKILERLRNRGGKKRNR